MDGIIIGSIIGGASFLSGIFGGVFVAAKVSGKREQKVEDKLGELEKVSHSAPCGAISNIKEDLAEIKNDIKWLVKQNGGGITPGL